MKYIAILLFGVVQAFGAWAQAQLPVVNRSVSPNAVAFGSANTAGCLIVVAITLETGTATVSSVADTRLNTYTQIGTIQQFGGTLWAQGLWYAVNCAAGANTVTVTFSAGTADVAIHEYSGIVTTLALDTNAQISGTGTPGTSPNITTTASGDLIFGFSSDASCSTAGAGFTQRIAFCFNVNTLTEDKNAPTPGVYNATSTGANTWAFHIAAFKQIVTAIPVGQSYVW